MKQAMRVPHPSFALLTALLRDDNFSLFASWDRGPSVDYRGLRIYGTLYSWDCLKRVAGDPKKIQPIPLSLTQAESSNAFFSATLTFDELADSCAATANLLSSLGDSKSNMISVDSMPDLKVQGTVVERNELVDLLCVALQYHPTEAPDTFLKDVSGRYLRQIFDTLPQRIWFKDCQNNILKVNQSAARCTNQSAAEIEGKSATDVYGEVANAYFLDDLDVLKSKQPKLDIIERIPDANGELTRWLRTDKYPVLHGDQLRGILVVASDITAERSVENERLQLLREIRTLFNAILHVVLVVDSKGLVEAANAAALSLFGCSQRSELIGKPISKWATPIRDALCHGNHTGSQLSRSQITVNQTQSPIEYAIRRIIWNGQNRYLVGINDRSQATLKDWYIEAAIEGTNVGFWELEFPTNRVRVSKELLSQLGLQEDWNEIQDFVRHVHPEDRRMAMANFENAIRDPSQEYSQVVRMLHANGSVRHIQTIGRIHRAENGEPNRAVGIHLDITEQIETKKSLESYTHRLEKSNSELERFAYAVSHDLKSPLRAIDQLLELLSEEEELSSEDREEIIAKIRSRSKRQLMLLNDLLNYARVTGGANDSEEIALPNLIENVFRDQLGSENFQLLGVEQLPTLTAVRLPLERVFSNLIANAIKHHPANPERRVRTTPEYQSRHESPTITVACSDHVDYFEFTVADNGDGFQPKYAEKIFDVFARLHSRDEIEGSGLGLAMVRKILDEMGAKIWVEAAPGQGATFRFTWPKRAERVEQAALQF